MRCIFCKDETASSRSVEHIIPEWLGNKEHVLPKGIVCDRCSRYFSLKIEKPLLHSGMFRLLRADRTIPSKKARIPPFPTTHDTKLPSYRVMDRFLGKVGLEVLAARVRHLDGWDTEVVDKHELDPLRTFVRYNRGPDWPFCYRTLYPVNAVFKEGVSYFEVLHEYCLLYTSQNELYIIVALFGVEFALNLGGPELDGFYSWLANHDYTRPLYSERGAQTYSCLF